MIVMSDLVMNVNKKCAVTAATNAIRMEMLMT